MVNYSALQNKVKDLLDRFGGNVQLVQSSKMVDSSDQPWRGASIPNVLPESASVTVKGVFDTISERDESGAVIRRGIKIFYTHGKIISGNETQKIEEFDYLISDGEIWKIVNVEVINPAGTRLLYELEVEQ